MAGPCGKKYSYGTHLCCKVDIFLFVLGGEIVPPFTEYLAHSPVILMRVFLMNKCSVTLAKDHEGIHWTANVFLLLPGLITGCLTIKRDHNASGYIYKSGFIHACSS